MSGRIDVTEARRALIPALPDKRACRTPPPGSMARAARGLFEQSVPSFVFLKLLQSGFWQRMIWLFVMTFHAQGAKIAPRIIRFIPVDMVGVEKLSGFLISQANAAFLTSPSRSFAAYS